MATITPNSARKKPKRVLKGVEHGLSAYTNYGCRCDVCRDANAQHSREYRARRFAGEPVCIFPRCNENQSQSYGNGLCYRHARKLLTMTKEHPVKAKRIKKKLGILT